MTNADDDELQDQLRRESDRLLDALDHLRRLEREKRGYEISSPEFHELANRIAERTRHVFRLAEDERETGEGFDEPQGESIDDVDA